MRDGEPCSHKGCLSHISHPCEGCGRIGGRMDNNTIYIIPARDKHVKIVMENNMFIEETEKEFEYLIKLIEEVKPYNE